MKYYIISGEASGDLHGANLVKELKLKDSEFTARGWGGDKMEQEGVELVKHYRDLAFMGFIEVVANLRTILSNIKLCKQDILDYKPDVVILIDYPGFNLRIAKFLFEHNIKVFYYISPQVWAWKQSRVKTIKKVVDKMFVILPFEKPFYEKFDYKVDYVGHPLLDEVNRFKANVISKEQFLKENKIPNKPIIALLPGSRTQEIKKKLPVMLEMVSQFKDYQFIVAGAPSKDQSFYNEFLKDSTVKLLENKTYQLLSHAHAALVTSGTATLETALFKVPQVVCYKASAVSYQIAKRLVKIDYISLANLIMDREVAKELIQGDLSHENLKNELAKVLNGAGREKMLQEYNELATVLGNEGASERVAQLMISYLK